MAADSFPIPRHWWGKIVGGVFGLLKGGLSGALIGLALGHVVDRLIFGQSSKEKTRRIFFTCLFACLGRVNKADGRVTEVEIASAERLMQRLELDEDERRMAIEAFNLGKAADFDLEGELQQFISYTRMRGDLRQMFMEVLLEGAAVDGRISSKEQIVLARVANAIQIPPPIYYAMYNAFTASHGPGSYTPGGTAPAGGIEQDLAALGLKKDASNQDVKRAYRKLVSQYHPDRLVSQGLPEEMMEKAKERVRDINLAYDRIKSARGIK
ncbi:MAG: co-chaperone DjlA [Pseudomonadota bacterium]